MWSISVQLALRSGVKWIDRILLEDLVLGIICGLREAYIVQCDVCHTCTSSIPSPLWTVHGSKANRDLKCCTNGSKATLLPQCLGCLIQFRIIHFWPEHLWTTRRRPKLASFDISTSKHRPVSLLMIGPFCNKNILKKDHFWIMITFIFVKRSELLLSFHLCKVPKPLWSPWDIFTFFQTWGTSSSVINEAFCVRQESGRPQGSKLEKSLGRVAGELQCRVCKCVTPSDSSDIAQNTVSRHSVPDLCASVGGRRWKCASVRKSEAL